MSAHPSSVKFADEMIFGWLDGLQMKYEDNLYQSRANIKISRRNGEDAGDIDALVEFNEAVPLNSLFPPGQFKIRPSSIQQRNPRISCLFGEFKRSLSSTTHLMVKVQQFIRFYSELLPKTGLSLPHNIKQSIDECTHLLFVFNGTDAADAETAFNNLGIRQIHGRPIVLVWANATEICTWADKLRTNKLLEEKDMVIDMVTAEKDMVTAEKDMVTAEKDMVIEGKDKIIEQQARLIEQLRAQGRRSSQKRSAEEMEYPTSSHTLKETKKRKK